MVWVYDLRRVSRSINYSWMCIFNLSWKWDWAVGLLSSRVVWISLLVAVWVSRGMLIVDICNMPNRVLIPDWKRWHFGSWLIGGSIIISTIFLFPAFMLFYVGMELFSADGFITDDAIYCIKGLFEIVGERTESIRISVIGRLSLLVCRISEYSWVISRIGCMSRWIDLVISNVIWNSLIVGNLLTAGHDWTIGGAQNRVIGILIWLASLWGVYDWYFLFLAEGMYILRYVEVDFATVEINIDFKVKGILSRVGQCLIR